MRRKAVKALVSHTEESLQHLKDDADEMLRGESGLHLHQSCGCGRPVTRLPQQCAVLKPAVHMAAALCGFVDILNQQAISLQWSWAHLLLLFLLP